MIERNDVFAFSETEKVVVMDVIKYNDIIYALVNGLTPDEQDVTDKYYIMEYNEEKGMKTITDKELLDKLLPIFSTRVTDIVNSIIGEQQ